MTDLTDVYNNLLQSTYCVTARSKPLYYTFFKPLIEKYLADTTKNYHIYVSTDNSLSYQAVWPSHTRLHYVSDDFVPTTVPNNANTIYFFHKKEKHTKEQQLALAEYVDKHPTMKYIYVGNVDSLLPFIRIKLFHYYLHFEICKSRWGRVRTGNIVSWKISGRMGRSYYNQEEKKKKATKPLYLYDHFLMHDFRLDESKSYKFNKKLYIPKKKPIVQVPVHTDAPTNTSENTPPTTAKPQVVIKYIYATNHTGGGNYLVMPDGKKENYNKLAEKYANIDLIEV